LKHTHSQPQSCCFYFEKWKNVWRKTERKIALVARKPHKIRKFLRKQSELVDGNKTFFQQQHKT